MAAKNTTTPLTPADPTAEFPVVEGEVPDEVPEGAEAPDDPLEAGGAVPVGKAKPVMEPEKGPGMVVAAAPTPLRLGTGAPGMVPLAAREMALALKAS